MNSNVDRPAPATPPVTAVRESHPCDIRRLGSGDIESIRVLYAGMDADDGYHRFFAPPPRSFDKLARLIALDDPAHCAVGAFSDGRLVGVANFVAIGDNGDAEIALVVDAARQHHGIGTELLRRLADFARDRGVQRFIGYVMPDNSKALELMRDIDFPVSSHWDDGTTVVEIQI